MATCSGQAIFLLDEDYAPGYVTVSLPYEFLPLPAVGETGIALDRGGAELCPAEVVRVQKSPATDGTVVLTMKIPVFRNTSAFGCSTISESEKCKNMPSLKTIAPLLQKANWEP